MAQAGKACYVEKPMARHAPEAQRMCQAFAERGLNLFVAYYRRRLPVFVRAKQLFDDGQIGRLTAIVHRHFSSTHRYNPVVRLTRGTHVDEFVEPYPKHVHQPLVETIVAELLGTGTCPSTGQSAWRTQWVMDQALAEYYGGRDDAFWERPETWPGRRQAT